MDAGLLFDPGHEFITEESEVTANDDFHFVAKTFADSGNNALEGFERAL